MKKLLMIYKRDGNKVLDDYVDEYKNYDKTKLVASQKIDGTSCLIQKGKLYKRYDNKKNKEPQQDWIFCYKNEKHNIYWVPVTHQDRWHIEAWYNFEHEYDKQDGTYELIGPKINGNKHNLDKHKLIPHKGLIYGFTHNKHDIPTGNETKETWKHYLTNCITIIPNIEGFVLWDIEKMEPMFKIRKKDLGMEW